MSETYQALYRKWRPESFSEIVDQDAVVRTLRRQVVTDRIAHAYLFCGSRGTGKTTAAKVLSRAVNCLDPHDGDPCGVCANCVSIREGSCMDVLEIDAASNNSVDDIRELRERVHYPPAQCRFKVYIIDEVHMLSTGAFNALLKTLEEPPKHAVFILATTDPQKLPATVLSRCQRFDFRRIAVPSIIGRLETVLGGMGREAEPDALNEIARAAEGALRDALSLLDVCLSFTDGAVTAELARDVLGTAGRDFMFAFADDLIGWNSAGALDKIDQAMRRGSDPRVLAADTAAHLRACLLAKAMPEELERVLEITREDAQRFVEQAKKAGEDQLLRAMELFMELDGKLRWAAQPRALLELAAVRACRPDNEADAGSEERLSRIEAMLAGGSISVKAAAPVTDKPKQPPAQKPQPAPRKAADPPQEYLDALERFVQLEPTVKRALPQMLFGGMDGDVVTVEFTRQGVLVRGVIERKRANLEAALSECFGRPVQVNFVNEGENRATVAGLDKSTKRLIEQSYDAFGRENIIMED